MLLPLHVIAGGVALVAGAVALGASKGSGLHRSGGLVFVASMLVMSGSGAILAAWQSKPLSVIAGSLTFYLVSTAVLTVRRPAAAARWLEAGAMLAALLVGASGIQLGLEGMRSTAGEIDGEPAEVAIVFGTIALLAAMLDLRMLLAGGINGPHRLARHLWRMCFALFLATASFFLGQAQVFPAPVRHIAVLGTPVLLVLLLMLYWLARVLFAKRYRRA